jgi:drug/metabolite transporter (DMT)-like permease
VPYADGQKELTGAQGDGTKFKFTAFMLLVQCCGNAVFSILAHYLTVPFGVWTPQEALREAQKKFPGAVITPFFSVLLSLDAFKVSFGYIFAMYSSNRALEYVSFTLQVLAKSCKMIPVMVGSVVILGKRYGLTKVLSVVIMTGGVIWFQMMEKKRPHKGGGGDDMGSVWGPLLLAASLAADGVSGPLQEDLKKKYVLTQFQQNLVSNLWAIVLMGLVTAFHDEWTPAVSLCPPLPFPRFFPPHPRPLSRTKTVPLPLRVYPLLYPPSPHSSAGLPRPASKPLPFAGKVHRGICLWPGLHFLCHPRVWVPRQHSGNHVAQAVHDRVRRIVWEDKGRREE